ncbi:MAG: hypothetical protein WC435_00740 [Candidatus Paceibacterota bacterium]
MPIIKEIKIRFQNNDRLDFRTHLKYISRLVKLSEGLSLSCSVVPLLNKDKIKNLKNKEKLIELTKQSIKDEHEIVLFDKEYSTAAVLWLPIKTYYLIYHILCVINYILTGEETSLSIKHSGCIDGFSKMLINQELQFSEPLFNNVYDKNILLFKEAPGEHLKTNVVDEKVFKLLMKKVAKEKIENYKIANGILNIKSQKNKDKVEKFKDKMIVSVFDFFYLMRLRMNYRNFNFIDNISSSDTKTYFEKYYEEAKLFYSCLSNLKDKLIADISSRT